ncbi:hypothetical protein WE348_22180 (plasmid) [Alteromonas macleodii]|jgi:hypothetical protein|nr:hypothetical protein [Alteromonas macleodii]|tara:strand:+ start:9318 stop:9599 length:282 start_codon:yes stop_codon:yes gene_type:complete
MRVNTSLEDHVKKNIGGTIVFNNGCWIDLTEEDGMFWGITPYGETWGCSAADNVVESIVNWISYWDKPRTETGALIKLFKSDMDQSPLKLPLS